MKRFLALVLSGAMVLSMLVGCNSSEDKSANADGQSSTQEAGDSGVKAPESDVEMQYMTLEEASGVLGTEGYIFFDLRKAEDYKASHIPGAVSHDMDAAKEGDFDAGVATMKAATEGVTDKLVLVCYSGKRYAQATTNVLSALGYDMSKVYTLEGGFTAWSETYPDNVEAE